MGDAAEPPSPERRAGPDRRSRPTPWMSRYWLRGRRRGARREGDVEQPYVDRYAWSDWVLVSGIVVLCAADFLLTRQVVSLGAIEANPLMNLLMQQGNGVFGAVKMGLTIAGMIVLLLHIRLPWVRRATLGVLAAYAALMLWHVVVSLDMHNAMRSGVGA